MRRKNIVSIVACAAASSMLSQVPAARGVGTVYTFVGASGATWSNAAAWSPNTGVPGVGDSATVSEAAALGINLDPTGDTVGFLTLGSTNSASTTDIGNGNSSGGMLTFDNTGGPNNTDSNPANAGQMIISGGFTGATNIISAPVGIIPTPAISNAPTSLIISSASTNSLSFSGGLVGLGSASGGTTSAPAATHLIQNSLTNGAVLNIANITTGYTTGFVPSASTVYSIQLGNRTDTTFANLNYGTVNITGTISNGPSVVVGASTFSLATQIIYGAAGSATGQNAIETYNVSGNNNYSGGTRLFRAQLVLENNNALGSGALQHGSGAGAGSMGFDISSNDDTRTIANGFTMQRNVTFNGNNSLTWTGGFTQSNASTLFNLFPAGKTLTLTGTTPSNATTPAWAISTDNSAGGRLFSFDGPGTTIVSGRISNGPLTYSDPPTDTIIADAGTTGQIAKNGDGILILSSTVNTYSLFSAANGGILDFTNTGAIGGNTVLANAGGAVGVDTGASTSASLIAKIQAAAVVSTGSLALSSADSAANFDFAGTAGGTQVLMTDSHTAGMSIGALQGGVVYTGTITPSPTLGYRLGGGGTLTLNTPNAITGANNLTVTNGGTVALTGANNYTGTTTIQANYIVSLEQAAAANNGQTTISVTSPYITPFFIPPGVLQPTILAVSSIADGNSGIGNPTDTSANSLVLKGGTLKITGSGGTSSRLFTVTPLGGTLDSSGSSPVNFSNIGSIVSSDFAAGTTTTGIVTADTITGLADATNLAVGMAITGSGIQNNTFITGIQPKLTVTSNVPGAITYTIFMSNNAAPSGTVATPISFFNQNRTLTLTGSNLGDNTISGILSDSATGSLGLAKSGSGVWLLNNSQNNFSGNIAISGGSLKVGSVTALGFGGLTRTGQSVGTDTVNSGTLDLNGQSINEPIVLAGGTLGNGSNSAAILGSGVAAVSTSTSGSTVPSGTTVVFTGGSPTTPATANLSLGISSSSLTLATGGTGYTVNDILNVTGGGGSGGQIRVLTIDGNGGVLTFNVANAGLGYTSTPTGANDISHTPTLAATFTGNNSFSVAGIAMTSPGSGYSSAPAVSLSNSSSLTSVAVLPTITLASSTTSSIGGSNGGISVPLAVTGTGSLNKIGTNTVLLSSSNSYTGNTTVSQGTLRIGNGSSLGIGGAMPPGQAVGVTTVTSGTLDLNGQTVNEPIVLNGGTLGNSGAATSLGTGLAGVSIGNSTNLPSNASLLISGGGGATASLNLALTQGTITLGGASTGTTAYKVGDVLTVSGGGGTGATIKILTLDVNNMITGYVLLAPGSGFTSLPTGVTDITTTTASGATFVANEGTFAPLGVTLTSPGVGSTSTPTAAVSSGTLSATAVPSSLSLASSSSIGGSGDISVPLNITGFGALTKVDADTVTLSAANNYFGVTNVNQGTLALTTTGSIANSVAVNVGTSGGSPTPGTLNLAASTSGILVRNLMSLNVTNGSANVLAAAAGTQNTIRSVLVTPSLTIGALGKLDLANNDLVLQGATDTSTLALLKAGFNAHAGYWNGTGGIVSSSAAGDSRFLTTLGYRQSTGSAFDGVSTTTGDTIVKYTYYGDADLNGTVNGSDYHQIDLGFGGHLTGWANGDFNYDGVVDGSDYALIDNTFNQISALGSAPLAIVASAANLVAALAALSAVPEPTTLGLLGIGAMSLLARRRRSTVR